MGSCSYNDPKMFILCRDWPLNQTLDAVVFVIQVDWRLHRFVMCCLNTLRVTDSDNGLPITRKNAVFWLRFRRQQKGESTFVIVRILFCNI